MRAIALCLMLMALVGCVEQRLPPEQVGEIRSLLFVVEPFDEIEVTSAWTQIQHTRQEYNPQTKRLDTVLSANEARTRGGGTLRIDLVLREHIRAVLGQALSSRYRIDPSDQRVPAIKEPFNPLGITLRGRDELIAEALEAAIPAGLADAILVIRGAPGTLDYNFGYNPKQRERGNAGRVQTGYDLVLVDGRRFAVLAAAGPRFQEDRRTPRPPREALMRPSLSLTAPHAYRIAVFEGDEKDLAAYRETLRQVIETAIPLQLRYLGLLEAPASGAD
jgi:hypothetical protein